MASDAVKWLFHLDLVKRPGGRSLQPYTLYCIEGIFFQGAGHQLISAWCVACSLKLLKLARIKRNRERFFGKRRDPNSLLGVWGRGEEGCLQEMFFGAFIVLKSGSLGHRK